METKNTRRRFAILGGVLAVVLVGIGSYLIFTSGEEETDDAQVSADVVPVGVRVAGQVLHVLVKENDVVKKDQPLAVLDDADYRAKEKQAEAELAIAEAQARAADAQVEVAQATSKGGLQSAQAAFSGSSMSVSGAEAQTAAARAGLMRAETELRRAQIDLARTRELRAANATTQEKLDNAQLAADTAAAALQQAKAQLAVAEDNKRMMETRVTEAKGRFLSSAPVKPQVDIALANQALAHARVKSAAAQLELAHLQVGYTQVRAPADGLASKLGVHEGQLVTVGQPVVELVPLASYLVANFKETQIGKMKAGQRAEVRIDAFPGTRLEGRVESISGGTGASFSLLPPDNASGNFVKVVQRVPVRIAWVNPPAGLILRAGLSADVTVHVR